MIKPFIRLLSFFSKEINEVRRQPRLVLSLLLGPFLILLLFGIGYRGARPQLRVAVVTPPGGVGVVNLDELKNAISTNLTLVSIDSDQAAALEKLERGQVDVVEILPSNVEQRVRTGQQSQVEFKYAEINPLDETWVQYLAYAQVNEINRALLEQAIAQAQQKTGVLSNLPPDVIVSPLLPKYENSRQSLSFVTFYAPAVLALILQHIAVTLGALSLVRERLLGAMEFFRVSPISVTNIILGKYLGYMVFLGAIGAVLVGLLLLLGIPFLGNVSSFVGLAALVILASLGIGFLISVISTSDSQAVQLSMLILLASIFFGGFFLPLENFWPPIRVISYALPLTHGIIGFQDIMLKGSLPPEFYWIVLGVIAGVTFILVNVLLRRQFQHL